MKRTILLSLILAVFVLSLFLILNQERKAASGLDGFYNLTLRDPLFYSSFFNSEEFEGVIQKLEESEDQLKEVAIDNSETIAENERSSFIQTIKETNLFPRRFLESLPLINEKTREFLESPSSELAEELLDLYDSAADFYLQDISLLISVLEKEEVKKEAYTGSGDPRLIMFSDSFSSFDIVKNDFLSIKENGDKLKEEIAKRRDCLSGKEDCQSLLAKKDNTSFISLLKEKDFNLQGEEIDFIRDMLPDSVPGKINEIKGPYKIKSSCWQTLGFEHWLYLIYAEQEDGRVLILPKLATQNYYRKVDFAFGPSVGTQEQKTLLGEGLEFVFAMDTPTYQCMDVSFYPQLLVIDFIKERIKKGEIASEDLEEKLDYKLLMENQFGLMAPVIDVVSQNLDILRKHREINGSAPSLAYLFTVRTAYSIFYFPFADSIWRINKELQYFLPEEKKPDQTRRAFFTMDALEELGYGLEEIRNFHTDINVIELLNFLLAD
jgi:hypothetical protein